MRAAFDDIAAESGDQVKKAEADVTAEIEAQYGSFLRGAEDMVGWALLKDRVIALQHGRGDDGGRAVTIAEANRDDVSCRILREFNAMEFAVCDHGQSKLAALVRTRKDRETTRKLNDAFATVLKTL